MGKFWLTKFNVNGEQDGGNLGVPKNLRW